MRKAKQSIHIRARDFDEARKMLVPLLAQRRLHITEMAALASAEIQCCLAEEQLDGARKWLEIWEGADPDHPEVKRLRQHFSILDAFEKLAQGSERRSRRKGK
jgi:hypothetical protein